jgi:hypothetical protein
MPFQMFVPGKRLSTIGTEDHFGSQRSVCTVDQKVELGMVEAALETAADNV